MAYYRETNFPQIVIDDKSYPIPPEVRFHFRNIHRIKELDGIVKVDVLGVVLDDRENYLIETIRFISGFPSETCIVFLDPDTGLEPNNANLNHVLEREAREIWTKLKPGDVFVFYQHQTNRNGQPWIEEKKVQLANAIHISNDSIKVAHGFEIATDVVFFYVKKA